MSRIEKGLLAVIVACFVLTCLAQAYHAGARAQRVQIETEENQD